MQVEGSKGGDDLVYFQLYASKGCVLGLVVIEALYGPAEPDVEAKDLTIDVTVPVQALVHNSQVFVPGRRTKVSEETSFFFSCPSPHVQLCSIRLVSMINSLSCRLTFLPHFL